MKKVVFLGNCQATRLWVLYNEQFQPITGDTTEMVVNFVDLTERGSRALQDADIIVAQAMDAEQSVSLDTIDTQARTVEFPLVTGLFLWPFFSGQPRVGNAPLPYLADGPYGQQFGDRWLDKKIVAGVEPDDIVEEYLALDVAKAVNLDRLYDLVMERARQRDRRTGFAIAPVIENGFRDRQLFMSPANPELELFRLMAAGVYRQLGISATAVNAILDTLWRSPFPIADHPVHPSVARHFGLEFVGPDTRYRTVSGERLTFREWVVRYVHYRWNDTLLEACSKASRIRRFDDEAEAVLAQIEDGLAQSDGSAFGETSSAHLLKLKGDLGGAIAATKRACAFDPSNPQIVGTLAIFLAEAGKLDEAEEAARRLVAGWPHYADGWNRLGVILERLGRPAEAVLAIAEAVRLAPRDLSYRKHLAAVLTRAGDRERARDVLADALATMSDQVDLSIDLSRLLADMGDLDGALVVARNAVRLDPGNASVKAHLANILIRRRDHIAASNVLKEAITLDPADETLPALLAGLLTRQGRLAEVEAVARDGSIRAPRNVAFHRILAELLHTADRLREAEQSFRAAVALAPNDADLHSTFALNLHRQGKLLAAMRMIERALSLAPNNPQVLARQAFLKCENGDLEGAKMAARSALALAPDLAGLHASFGDILEREGDFMAAVSAYRSAMRLDPGNALFRRQTERLEQLAIPVSSQAAE
jgi:Flp pilus assembly protein TadD